MSTYDKEYVEANKEKIRASQKKHYLKLHAKGYFKDYYLKNREKILARAKEWNKNHRENVKMYKKKHIEKKKLES